MHLGHVACICLAASACAGSTSSSPPQPSARSGDWSCVGGAAGATPLFAARPPGAFDVSLQDASTHAGVGREELAVCARADEDCLRPFSRGRADDAGKATLTAPGGPSSFDGFVRVTGADIATHYVFLPHRAGACAGCAIVLPVYTPSALATTAHMTGLTIDRSGALVRVDLEDCSGAPARDATVSIGSFGCRDAGATFTPGELRIPFGRETCAGPVVAYATGGHGNVSRTALSTDATGVALGFGVPDGQLGIAEMLDQDMVGGALGFARAGAISTFVVRP